MIILFIISMAKLHLPTLRALPSFIFFTMALYFSTYFYQSIAAIIKPPVQDVVQFLKEHIQHDIRCIVRCTGNSDEEAMRLIHLVLVGIVNNMHRRGGTFWFPVGQK